MNKKTIISIIIAFIIFLVCTSIVVFIYFFNKNSDIIIPIEEGRYNNVTVDVIMSTVSPTGASILIEDGNESTWNPYWEYVWAIKYKIQKKVFNKWKDVKIQVPEEQITYNEDIEKLIYTYDRIITIDWKKLYGELPRGTYRIVQYTADTDEAFYSNEFTLPTSEREIPDEIPEEERERYSNATIDVLLNSVTPTSAKMVFTDKNGEINNYKKYFWDLGDRDLDYELQKKKNNKWEKVEITRKGQIIGDLLGYDRCVAPLTKGVGFEYLYGKLSEGTYRIVKKADDDIKFYSNEFIIKNEK